MKNKYSSENLKWELRPGPFPTIQFLNLNTPQRENSVVILFVWEEFFMKFTPLIKLLLQLFVQRCSRGQPSGLSTKSGQLVEEPDTLWAGWAVKPLNVVLAYGSPAVRHPQFHQISVFCLCEKICCCYFCLEDIRGKNTIICSLIFFRTATQFWKLAHFLPWHH